MGVDETYLLLIGYMGSADLGTCFSEAATELGLAFDAVDARLAHGWMPLERVLDKTIGRPSRSRRLQAAVIEAATRVSSGRDKCVLTTGTVPVRPQTLHRLQAEGFQLLHYASDDPFSNNHNRPWYLQSLRDYDIVFSPRRSNLGELRALGCRKVVYTAFGYRDSSLRQSQNAETNPHVLFVGGADDDRAGLLRPLLESELELRVAGGTWGRFPDYSTAYLGCLSYEQVRLETQKASVNICIVRKSNRDGHVMRSFEIAAAGACMVAEDTDEHRSFFGPDGDAVLYFDSGTALLSRCRELMNSSSKRQRLRRRLLALITSGSHSYSDRLQDMLSQTLSKGQSVSLCRGSEPMAKAFRG